MTRVVVVGGGLSGLATACALADRGLVVTLLESRPRLGGRASSFDDRETGETIDNCQHVAMGCCTNYLHFCRTIGVAGFLSRQTKLNFVDTDGSISRFVPARWLPAPLHLLPALRRLRYVSREDRALLAQTMRDLSSIVPHPRRHVVSEKFLRDLDLTREQLGTRTRAQGSHVSIAQFLTRVGMPEHLIKKFWHVVLVSALSESLENISLAQAAKVFCDGFLRNRTGWEVLIPTVPLDEFYGSGLNSWLAERSVTVRLNASVAQLEEDEFGRIRGVRLKDGTQIAGDQFVVAVPWFRAKDLFSPWLQSKLDVLHRLDEIPSAAISSVHLWFQREVTDLAHAVFVDHLSQWMFNRSRLMRESESTGRHYYQVVISDSSHLRTRSRQDVIEQVCGELLNTFSPKPSVRLLHSRVVSEHRAVFSPRPGVEELRPPQRTSIDNLHLAGDWTQTGWPATMEGAVRGGYLAAESVLESLGCPETVLQPDLPTAWLSRRIFGFD